MLVSQRQVKFNIDQAFQRLLRGDGLELNAYLTSISVPIRLINTNTLVHCYIIKHDGNDRPRVKDLAKTIAYSIVEYAIPRSEITEAQSYDTMYNTTRKMTELKTKAQRLFTKLKKTGEGGELLLYMLIQNVLRIPQILCKMSLKTSSQMHYHGADGIHAMFDNTTGKLALYWGESKLYSSIGDAISSCLDSIKPFLIDEGSFDSQQMRDLQLMQSNIDLNDEELENAFLEFLDPDHPNFCSLQYRAACLIGFDEKSYPTTPNTVSHEKVKEEITKAFTGWQGKLNRRIKNRSPLDTFEIEVFLVPFPSVEEFRQEFLGEIHGG